MITLEWVYRSTGLMFATYALMGARDASNPRRWRNAGFWGLLAVSFLAGSQLGDCANGCLALALAVLAGRQGLGAGRSIQRSAAALQAAALRHGNRLFLIALLIPALALAGALGLGKLPLGQGLTLFSSRDSTLVALGVGVAVALVTALFWLRAPLSSPMVEGRRLMDSVGWAAVLPQMLAALGAVFAVVGVGDAVGRLIGAALALDTRLLAVSVYCVGMALFTVVMGNAFAAFPVMTAAVGLPLVIHAHGGDPAVVCAIGMLSGFCGTLLTPMAANFNVVPASLLELPDRDAAFNGVIRAQAPTALIMLAVNTALMAVLAF